MHRLHQEAELLRQLAAHAADARQQFPALGLVDQRHQPEADFQSDQIHRLHVVPGQLALLGIGSAGAVRPAPPPPRSPPGARDAAGTRRRHRRRRANTRNATLGMPGIRPMTPSRLPATASPRGCRNSCLRQFAAQILGARHARDDDGHAGRQQQRRNLRHQAVADRQQRVDARRIAEAHAVAQRADGKTADHVDDQDQDAGGRIAAHELAGTVHGTVEVGFGAHLGAPHARLVLVDEAGVEIGIDRHLLAGHRSPG